MTDSGDATTTVTAEPPRARPRPPAAVGAAFVVLCAVVGSWAYGFLPWILDGLSSPVPGAGPFGEGDEGIVTAVPMVGDHAIELLVCGLLGGLGAVLVSAIGGRSRTRSLVVAAAVVLLAVGLGTWSASRLRDASTGTAQVDDRLLTGLQVLYVAAVLAGVALGLLALAAPPALRLVLLAGPAVLLRPWVASALLALGAAVDTTQPLTPLRWLPGLVAGVALGLAAAFCLRRVVDLWAVVPAVAVGLFVEALLPALVLVQDRLRPGSGLGEGAASELTSLFVDVVRSTLRSPDVHLWWMWGVAVVVAVVAARRRSRWRDLTRGA